MPIIQVIACGNPLRGDDGVGWQLAKLLDAASLREGIHITFTPQLLPEHAEILSAADLVIFLDCSALTPPGKVSTLPIVPAADPSHPFTHHLEPSTLLRLALDLYGRAPARAVMVTVGGESFVLGEGLRASVAAAIPAALSAVRSCFGT